MRCRLVRADPPGFIGQRSWIERRGPGWKQVIASTGVFCGGLECAGARERASQKTIHPRVMSAIVSPARPVLVGRPAVSCQEDDNRITAMLGAPIELLNPRKRGIEGDAHLSRVMFG